MGELNHRRHVRRRNRAKRVIVHDESGWVPSNTPLLTQLFLTSAWAVGAKLFKGVAIGASDWPEAIDDLAEHQERRGVGIRIISVWGHGSKGHPYIGPDSVLDLHRLHNTCPDLQAIMWRSCSVHADPDFALRVCEATGAISVGHCVVISAPNPLKQKACCALRPGEAPHWRRKNRVWVSYQGDGKVIPLPAISTFSNRIPYSVPGVFLPRNELVA